MYESEEIVRRYERRKKIHEDILYSPLRASTFMSEQEKERSLIKLFKTEKLEPLGNKRLLEIGCGNGLNLLQFIRLGFNPSNLFANDILPESISQTKLRLPSQVTIIEGDILEKDFSDEYFEIVFQSMVFSSILDYSFKKNLALKMWNWTKRGGGILWYDFIYNNPRNKDVEGVPMKQVKELFPEGKFRICKITLAPPISRFVCKFHPSLYYLFTTLRVLRTHVLCFIRKN